MLTVSKAPKTETTSIIKFEPGWHQVQSSPIYQGGKLVIDYDPVRLPTCRGGELYGLPGWQIDVFVKFYPDGQLHTGKVLQLAESEIEIKLNGFAKVVPVEFDVPEDATHVEIWFYNADRTGCVAWDSRYGQNYHYPVYPVC